MELTIQEARTICDWLNKRRTDKQSGHVDDSLRFQEDFILSSTNNESKTDDGPTTQ
jgi:hypothetical protein